jgi:hypothetical protein
VATRHVCNGCGATFPQSALHPAQLEIAMTGKDIVGGVMGNAGNRLVAGELCGGCSELAANFVGDDGGPREASEALAVVSGETAPRLADGGQAVVES